MHKTEETNCHTFLSPSAIDDLSHEKRCYIEKTVYTRDVELTFSQMTQMIHHVFKASDFPAIPFVHRLTATNVDNDCMV